jgi:hypothetical protein
MSITISIPAASAYGAGEAVPDKPVGMSIDDAIYRTVHNYPGGVAALAARMGVSPNTLTHKVNPNNATHHLHPRELVAMQFLSGDVTVLHAMAAALGYSCTPCGPDQAEGDPVEAFMHLQSSFGELVKSIADPLARMQGDAAKMVTPSEMRRADHAGAAHHATVDGALAALRGHMRPLPKDAA